MKCNKCGNMINKTDNYCMFCGNHVKNNNISSDNNFAIVSIIFGILSIVFGITFVPFGIIGLIFGLSQKGKSSYKNTGIVLNIIGIFISIICLAFFIYLFSIIRNSIVEGEFSNSIDSEVYDDWDDMIDTSEYKINTKNIEGGWKIVNQTENDFLVLRNGMFYYYKDINNKEDNFMMGNYEVEDMDEANNCNIIFKPSRIVENMEEIDSDIEKIEGEFEIINHYGYGIEGKLKIDSDLNINYLLNDNYIKIEE